MALEYLYARDVYGKTLVEIGKEDENLVVCDADLSNSTRTAFFAREFPERFFNFGVAEQNMIATAAGLASCGKIVFVSTFAVFAVMRALDQIRNTVCYNNFNVKIVATHSGITVGEDGASHQALEDIAFLRAIPNMKIIVPADAQETREAVIAAYRTPGPFYIRLGRSKVPTVEGKQKFEIGKGYFLKEGKDIAIIACGLMVSEAIKAAEELEKKNISATVINMHTIKPLDNDLLKALADRYRYLVVCEEHQSIGGLFSAVCEALSTHPNVQIYSIGIKDRFGQSGSPQELLDAYQLSYPHIVREIENIIGS